MFGTDASGVTRHTLLNLVLGRMHYDQLSAGISLLAEPATHVDARTWTFRIRKNLTFHTGQKVTARNFKAAFEWLFLAPYNTPELSQLAGYITPSEIAVVDDFTLVFNLQKPCLWFDRIISGCAFSPVPTDELNSPQEHMTTAAQASGAHFSWKRFPIGAGPYKISEVHEGGQRLVLERHLMDSSQPTNTFGRIVLSTGLKADQADVVFGASANPNPARLHEFKTNHVFCFAGIYFDYRSSWARKRDFRRAVAMAIDSQAVAKAFPDRVPNRLLFGKNSRPRAFDRFDEQLVKSYNPIEARRIFKDLGLSNQILFLSASRAKSPYSEMLVRQLNDAGLKVEFVQNGTFDGSQEAAENTPLTLVGFVPSIASDLQVFRLFRNKSGWVASLDEVRAEYEELNERALLTTDRNLMEDMNLKLLGLMCQEIYAIPLFEDYVSLFADPAVVDKESVHLQSTALLTALLRPVKR
jgi:ABC-type transport system substrate-binding protein